MEFLWDEGNVSKNVAKHKVSNKETEQAVQNEPVDLEVQLRNGEIRQVQIGVTDAGRVLVVVSTLRGDKVRVISSRPANREERAFFKEERDRIHHGEESPDSRHPGL